MRKQTPLVAKNLHYMIDINAYIEVKHKAHFYRDKNNTNYLRLEFIKASRNVRKKERKYALGQEKKGSFFFLKVFFSRACFLSFFLVFLIAFLAEFLFSFINSHL